MPNSYTQAVLRGTEEQPIGLWPLVHGIFNDRRMAPLWLLLRVYLGWQWLTAGLEKVQNPAWTRSGVALQGFWASATKIQPGAKGATLHYGWYYTFLHSMLAHGWYSWFGKLVAFGETAIGIGLILGAFVGVAALFGAFLNLNFMLAGASSSNPLLLVFALLLLASLRVSSLIGVDRYAIAAIRALFIRTAPLRYLLRWHAEATVVFVSTFGATAVAAIVLNIGFGAGQPWPGYLIVLAGVAAAWFLTAAALNGGRQAARRSERLDGVPVSRARHSV